MRINGCGLPLVLAFEPALQARAGIRILVFKTLSLRRRLVVLAFAADIFIASVSFEHRVALFIDDLCDVLTLLLASCVVLTRDLCNISQHVAPLIRFGVVAGSKGRMCDLSRHTNGISESG